MSFDVIVSVLPHKQISNGGAKERYRQIFSLPLGNLWGDKISVAKCFHPLLTVGVLLVCCNVSPVEWSSTSMPLPHYSICQRGGEIELDRGEIELDRGEMGQHYQRQGWRVNKNRWHREVILRLLWCPEQTMWDSILESRGHFYHLSPPCGCRPSHRLCFQQFFVSLSTWKPSHLLRPMLTKLIQEYISQMIAAISLQIRLIKTFFLVFHFFPPFLYCDTNCYNCYLFSQAWSFNSAGLCLFLFVCLWTELTKSSPHSVFLYMALSLQFKKRQDFMCVPVLVPFGVCCMH